MAANQISSLLKVNQLSKDLNMKSKELTSLMEEKGVSFKSQTLTPGEFGLLMEVLTTENQVRNIEDYLDGITCIPSKKAARAEKSGKEKSADVAAEPVKKADEKPVAEAEKPAKTEKVEQPEKVEKTEKTEKKAESVSSAAESAPAVQEKKPVREEEKNVRKPEPVAAKRPEPAGASAASQTQRDGQRPARPATPGGAMPGATRPAGQGMGRPAGNGYGQGNRPQGGFGQNRPSFGGQQQGGFAPRTQQSQGTGGFGNRGPGMGGAARPPFGDKPRQGNGFGDKRKPNNFGSGKDGDGESRRPGGLKETFKPTAITRGQTEKGTKSTKPVGTRVVDMRGTAVDLSKYDEKLDNYVPDSVGDVRGGNERFKKPSQGGGRPSFGAGKNNRMATKGKKGSQPVTKAPTSVTLPDEIQVSELASRLKVTSGEVVKRLMMLGMMVTVNQTVDYDTAAIVAEEMGISATREVVVTIEERLFDETEDSDETLEERAPVVCVMGHVDHGKTSILDAIRHTNVTSGEAGGITQHIGAYRVKVKGHDITFLDTPGHEAFTAMRARGAQATDIAILVVAADDGIMPQTVEAINHAKAAGIDIVVAINKMDKPGANPDAIKQELTKYDLVPEEWGGDVICVPVSALTGAGIDDLLESVLLVAEVKELKANPNRRAKGIVIEAKLDKGRGPVATVLVQNGTLHSGDIVIAGTAVGHVRAMTDDKGRNVKDAKPSVPVEIIGLAEVPNSGDEFNAVEDERMARMLADQRREKAKEEVFKANARANLNDLFAQISEGAKQLNIIVKADVGGSVEAVKQSLEKISNDEVKVCVIHGAAGAIREGDVMLAAASNAIIVGFNVRPDKVALDSAERQNVEIRTYRVIYDCINEITDAMKGMLAPKYRENLLGHAEVRQTIHVPNVGTIAGSYVQDGKVVRSAMIRVVRDGIVIFEDKISSLRRFKDDVREVAQGYECGIGLERFNDIKVGDVLEAYVMEEIER